MPGIIVLLVIASGSRGLTTGGPEILRSLSTQAELKGPDSPGPSLDQHGYRNRSEYQSVGRLRCFSSGMTLSGVIKQIDHGRLFHLRRKNMPVPPVVNSVSEARGQ